MTDPNPVVAALLASGRRELAKHRVTHLHKPKPTPPEDTAVSHVDDPQPPMPAEGAAYAYVAVERTFSPYADRPEWDFKAVVIPEWNHKELEYWRNQDGHTLIPIGPDGDTGTRAITEPEPTKPALEMVEDALYRNPAGGQVRVVQMLRNPLAPGMWSAMVPGIFGDHYAEVTAEGLVACGYTLVTEDGSDGE